MGFERQLDLFVVTTATLITFVVCVMFIGIPIRISILVAVCVLLGGLFFGRRFAEAIVKIFS